MTALYTQRHGHCYLTGDDFLRSGRRRSALLNDLVAHWRLEEASGTRADAHAGNTLGAVNNPGQAAGKIGNAASFIAASEQALGITDNPALSMGNIDFTIAGWVRFDTLTGAGILAKWTPGSAEYLIHFDGTNLRLHVSDDGTNSVFVSNSAAISANTWYFFVAWHDAAANTINLSVNNNAAASAAHSTGVHDGTATLYLALNEESLTYLNGRLDSISLWKRVLTSSERTQLYNSGNGLDYPFN